jgi:putative phosphoesterase
MSPEQVTGRRTCVGIISDTHGWFHPAIPEAMQGVDLIIHAGDIGTPDVLDKLEAIAPTAAVYGNVDGREIRLRTVEDSRIVKDGVRFWTTHIGGTPKRFNERIRELIEAEPPDVFICGHSHILRVDRVLRLDGMLFINPGAAGRQGFHQVKTMIRLYLEGGKPVHAESIHLDGKSDQPTAP